jgi:transposase
VRSKKLRRDFHPLSAWRLSGESRHLNSSHSLRRGEGTGDVCSRFGVSRKSVERFWNQHRLTGECRPKKIGGYRRSRLEKHDRTLRRWIR